MKAPWQKLFVLFLALGGASAGATRVAEEQALKAAYLYNFAKFVEWPGERNDAPLRLCVLGEQSLSAPFQKIQGRSAQNRTIEVALVVAEGFAGGDCEILFISREAGDDAFRQVLGMLDGKPVLTVSDIDDFASQGGMIEFRNVGEHIKFVVNITASRDAQLSISAFLLQLALEVRGTHP